MPYNCLIVDDEPIAHRILESYCLQMSPLETIFHAYNAPEARVILDHENIDILLLDIQMPEETGIQFLTSLEKRPITIFTTAYLDYALDGFELGVMDYLVKPIRFERFQRAIDRAVEFLELEELKLSIHQSPINPSGNVVIQSGNKQLNIEKASITHVQGLKDYAIIHTPQKRFVVRETMHALETLLTHLGLVRVHKSFIVARDKLAYCSRYKIEFDGFQIPVGRTYRAQVK